MPASLIRHLRDVFNDDALAVQVSGGNVELTESDRQATLRKVKITGIGGQALIVRLGANKHISGYFRDGEHNKACDWMLFVGHGGKKMVVCIEMKSSVGKLSGACLQFRSSAAFMDYVFGISKWLKNHDVLNEWERRFVCLHPLTPLNKQPTRRALEMQGNEPKAPRCIGVTNGGSLYLKAMI